MYSSIFFVSNHLKSFIQDSGHYKILIILHDNVWMTISNEKKNVYINTTINEVTS